MYQPVVTNRFTKGPMGVSRFPFVRYRLAQEGQKDHAVVFPVSIQDKKDAKECTPEQRATAKADATLYAASPALLEANELVDIAWAGGETNMSEAANACRLAIALAGEGYTEGPLEIRQFSPVDFAIAQVGKMPHGMIYPSGVYRAQDVAKATPEQVVTAKADATLYAASPALLEAAKLFVSSWMGGGSEDERMSSAVDACLLAIALAGME